MKVGTTLGLIILFGIVLNGFLLRYIWNRNKSKLEENASSLLKSKNDLEALQIKTAQTIDEQKNSIDTLKNELSIVREKIPSIETSLAYEREENRTLKLKISPLEEELRSAREHSIAIETEKNILNEQRQINIKQIEEMQSAMKVQFENLANKIFIENSNHFKQESQARLGEILSPLKENIEGFKKKLEDAFGEQTKQQLSLKSEIEQIVKVNAQMSSQTTNLTNALKGDFRTQGTWGEFVLERILEESGLRAGEDYILQGAKMGIKHSDDNQRLKPDVIIKLPDSKHVVIDSKVSLTDYEKLHAVTDEQQKSIYLKQFLTSIKNHVTDLKNKRYQDADPLSTPDFVLMFMPIESAYSLVMKNDRELHNYAWSNKVIIVCPTTLYTTLRTIASIWKIELQKKHSLEIAKQGGLLYDKIYGFVEDMQKLGKQLKTSQESYDSAMNKLSTGKGNILIKAQQLDKLGVKTAKKLLKLIPDAFDEIDIHEGDAVPDKLDTLDAADDPSTTITTTAIMSSNEDDDVNNTATNDTFDDVPF
ncbi:MAG: DNA recombination protein RmuC [Gammaproteobacteria bacterium]